ncbi:MAG: D-alanyl-D-alanine carboxypeptidase/D-alanyl-D-alanine-endopeptidase [Ignavibacteriae bacterium]|nr:D-alanyl-D-alanine carboxypeptidase/D-alanyl-D-alanine-endopeptidase [Ignavibacteriota bacterium]
MKNINKIIFFILILQITLPALRIDSTKAELQKSNDKLLLLRNEIDDILSDPNFSNAVMGVYVKSIKNGEVLYKRNQDKLFVPASAVKLFTTAAALLYLGPNYKYETTLYASGEISENKITGNLIVKGSGDPTISNRFENGKSDVILNKWAVDLKNLGIETIDGNLIGDATEFEESKLGKGWSWEHESYWYSAKPCALSFNNNSIAITIFRNNKGNIIYKTDPETNYVTIINRIENSKFEPTNIELSRKSGTNIINLIGNISEDDDSVKVYASVDSPSLYFISVFNDVLVKNNIQVEGYIADSETIENELFYQDYIPLFTHTSPVLKEIIWETNKNSNNFYAEQILRTIGLEIYNYGSGENGIKALYQLFNKMGINENGVKIVDGSGLSMYNLVTPKQIVNLLIYMFKSDQFDNFYNSLPIAGYDGTMADRMKKTNVQKKVRAKPGFMENVKSLSGYVQTQDNELLAFSIIVNNFIVPSNLVNYIQDNICLRLANFSRK